MSRRLRAITHEQGQASEASPQTDKWHRANAIIGRRIKINEVADDPATIVDVNSCDPVRHGALLESVPRRINQGRKLSRGRGGPRDAQLFGQSRTLRIKQLLGLTGSTG